MCASTERQLLSGAVQLARRHVAARDDRREHRDQSRSESRTRSARGAAELRLEVVAVRARASRPMQEQQADLEHRHAEVRRDQLLLEALLHGQPAERRLRAGSARSAPMLTRTSRRLRSGGTRQAPSEQAIRTVTTRGEDAVRVLDDHVACRRRGSARRRTAASPPCRCPPAPQPEARVADAHDSADDDQQERQRRRRVCERCGSGALPGRRRSQRFRRLLGGSVRAGPRRCQLLPVRARPRAPASAPDVLHRLGAAHDRDHVEVVRRRRRGREPLERVGAPRVGARRAALADAHERRCRPSPARPAPARTSRSWRRGCSRGSPSTDEYSTIRRGMPDSPAEYCGRKVSVEADHHQPERELAEVLRHHAARSSSGTSSRGRP